MADNMKNIGVPIKDDDLDGVVGGVNIPLTDEEIDNLSERLREPAGSSVTVEPLDNEITRRAAEFQQGRNLPKYKF